MSFMPLLPRTKGPEWPAQTSAGLHIIPDVDYQRNLCESYYEASDYGTPSPLAYPRVFADRLETYLKDLRADAPRPRFAELFDRWALIIPGIFFGLITVRQIAPEALGDLGRVLAPEFPEGYNPSLLICDNVVLGLTDPRVGAVLSVRIAEGTLDRLRARLVEETRRPQASSYFGRWARRQTRATRARLLFSDLLDQVGRRVAGREEEPLADEQMRTLDRGATLLLDDGRGESMLVEVPRYTGTPVICGTCGYEIGKEAGKGAYVVKEPDDCRCKQCLAPQDWLEPHSGWLRFSRERGEYLIYALSGSPIFDRAYPYPVLIQGDGVEITTGTLRLKVLGTVISETRLKCSRLTFFRDGHREPTRPTLPVRGDYFGLVEPARESPHRSSDGTYIVPLRVLDWEHKVYLRYEKQEIHEKEEALLLVWPRFRLEGWRTYFFLLEVQPRLREAGVSLRLLRRGRAPEPLGNERTRGTVEEPFDALEVVFSRDGGGHFEHGGIFEPAWDDVHRGEVPATLAIDFGTSTTTVWYDIAEQEPRPLRFGDFTETVISNEYFEKSVLGSSFWLPSYLIDDRGTALAFFNREVGGEAGTMVQADEVVAKMNYFVPSELVVRTPESTSGLGEAIYDFSICHPYGARVINAQVLYELKSLPPEGSLDGRFTFVELVSRYLEIVLLVALATIVQRERRVGVLNVRTAFPRAFTSQKLERYIEAFDRALDWIADRTGFRTKERLFLDESRAASHAMPAYGEVALVMDMGGGTTDVGIFEYRDGVLDPLLTDSLQYGGNDFLRMLVREKHLFPKPSEREENQLLWLLRETRLRGFGELVRTYYTGDKTARNRAIGLLRHFYQPLAYFVRRLFDALPALRKERDLADRPITVYLVGNGWLLAEAVPVADTSLGSSAREILGNLLASEGFANLTIAGEPRSIGPMLDWPGPKAAVAYGLLNAPADDLWRSLKEAGTLANGVRTIVGFDVAIDDGSNTRLAVPWRESVPLKVANKRCKVLLGDVASQLPAAWSKFITFEKGREVTSLQEVCRRDIEGAQPRLTRSVLVRFIENVYKGQLSKAERL